MNDMDGAPPQPPPFRDANGGTHDGGMCPPMRENGGDIGKESFEYRKPTVQWPFPFTERQFAKLLALKGRVENWGNAEGYERLTGEPADMELEDADSGEEQQAA